MTTLSLYEATRYLDIPLGTTIALLKYWELPRHRIPLAVLDANIRWLTMPTARKRFLTRDEKLAYRAAKRWVTHEQPALHVKLSLTTSQPRRPP